MTDHTDIDRALDESELTILRTAMAGLTERYRLIGEALVWATVNACLEGDRWMYLRDRDCVAHFNPSDPESIITALLALHERAKK